MTFNSTFAITNHPLNKPLRPAHFLPPYVSQPIPPTTLQIYNHLLTSSYNTAQLQLLITKLFYRPQITQPPDYNRPSTNDSPETLSIIRTLCILLQSPKHAEFADIKHTDNEHVEKLQNEVYELTQKQTLYPDFLTKLTLFIQHLKISANSHD